MHKTHHPISDIEGTKPLLNKISIFNGLRPKQLDEIFKLLKIVHYDKGEFIFKRGETLSYIYIIKQGEVKMILEEKDVCLELVSFKEGDCFGETSVIGIQSHSSNALVVQPTELIVLEPKQLLNIYETDKEIFGLLILNIARETARRLHRSNEELIQKMLKKDETTRKGFTLVEILVVLVIIGILATISSTNFSSMLEQGNAQATKNNMQILANAEQAYYLKHDVSCFCSTGCGCDLTHLNANLNLNITNDNTYDYVCMNAINNTNGVACTASRHGGNSFPQFKFTYPDFNVTCQSVPPATACPS